MYLWSLRLGVFITYLFLGLLQVFAREIDDLLVCRICNGYQICGRKHSQTPECLNGIPCTVEQYRLCGMMVDTIINKKCDHPGIFPDPKCPRQFYTCDKSRNTSSFVKRTWTCPPRKTFDPVTKHCLSTDEKRMLQVVQNYNRLNTTADDGRFVCRKVGIFPDPHDCKMYHSCNRKLEPQDFYCSEGTYFDGVDCSCEKTQRCLSQLEKNSQKQLEQGEEIYKRVRKLLELENGFQDTTETNHTHFPDDDKPIPESVNQTLRSMWNLQRRIRDKIHELQKMSERSFIDLQNLLDGLTTVAEEMSKNVKIMTGYTNEKICSEMKKLDDKGSVKLNLSLCNTDVKCYCLKNDNGINKNWRNSTVFVPITNTQTQSLPHDVTTIQSYFNTTTEHKLTAIPNFETSTSKSYTETISYHKTETETTTHGYSTNSIQQEQTSNYHETEHTISPTHKTTTTSSLNEYNETTKYAETTTFVLHDITTTVPQYNTKTPDSTEQSQDDNYNETDIGQTAFVQETTEFYSKPSTADEEAQEGKTSNYRTTKISDAGNYTNTTPHVVVYMNNDNESHVTQELETAFPSETKTATTEINTRIQVYVTTARSDMQYTSDIQSTYYGGTNSTSVNDMNTTGYSTTHQIDVYDRTHVEETVSSGETTVESDTEYPTVNEETRNGSTIADLTMTTVEESSKSTFSADINTTDKEHAESDTNEEKTFPMHEPKTTESTIETTFHTDVRTHDEDDGHQTLKEQTLLYQTERSTLNEETGDIKTTNSLEEKLTTTGFDSETTLHEDTNNEKETAPDFEQKTTTTEFYREQSSVVQDNTEPTTNYSSFEPSTTGFHTETTLHIQSDEENEKETTAPFTITATGFDNETTSYTYIHSNVENEHTSTYETTATPKHEATEQSSYHDIVEEITHPPTEGTNSEPATEANTEVALTPAQKIGGFHSETTVQVDVHDGYDTQDQNYTNDEYDIDNEVDTDVQYDYSVTYDVKTTSPFDRKNTATEFSTVSMPHSKSYSDSEKRYTTQESETTTKYISAAYGESTLHMVIQTSEKYNDILKEAIEISDSEHSPHGVDIQDTETTAMSDSYSRTTNGFTSVKGDTTFLTNTKAPKSYKKFISTHKTIKNESRVLNPEKSPPKGTNRFYKTDSTSKLSPDDAIRRAVTTETILSTFLGDTMTTEKPRSSFRCSNAGYFADPEDCHSFYRCSAVLVNKKPCSKCDSAGRWKLVETHHTCKNGRWFSKYLNKCVKFKPLLC